MRLDATWHYWDQSSHAMKDEQVVIMDFLMAPGHPMGDYGVVYNNAPEAFAVIRRATGRLCAVPVEQLETPA